ncbi:hypothetical protein TYRP_004773 [Tyrophagus putrescentiae]|nr:hypothetical protein TYRP_004773 [Tyrophagus putrescentiae]
MFNAFLTSSNRASRSTNGSDCIASSEEKKRPIEPANRLAVLLPPQQQQQPTHQHQHQPGPTFSMMHNRATVLATGPATCYRCILRQQQ